MNRPFDRDAVGVTQPYPKMTPEASAAWNTWATGLAERVASVKITALQKQMVDIGEALFGLVKDAGSEVRLLRDRVKELEAETVQLRERTASLTGEMRGRALGTETALPALPDAARAHRARQN